MANRSDFYSAKLPRYLKKMLALGEAFGSYNKAEARQARKAFIEAHAIHVGFKMKRNTLDTKESAGE